MSQLSFADFFNMTRETADNPPVIQVRPQVAEVVTGNTLTMQFRRVRYTPCITSMTSKNVWQT